MNQSKISVRYAKALFMLSVEQGTVEQAFADMALVHSAYLKIPELMQFLLSPIVKPSDKQKMISQLFSAKISDLTLRFLKMIIHNKRENYIPDIARNFFDLYRKEKGIKTAKLTSAVKIDDAILKKLSELIAAKYGKKVEMTETVDERIIGGFILRLDDQQLDASVATGLKKLKQNLIASSSEKI